MGVFGISFKDRRNDERIRTYKKAIILYYNNACQMSCTILDYSKNGARLKTVDPLLLPGRFDLRFAADLTLKCDVVRRSGDEIGVKFI